ncbi:MAG TPA: hypothetical protein VGM91_16700 [Conexibacter sp.]
MADGPRRTGVSSTGGYVTRRRPTTSRAARSRSTANNLRIRRAARAADDGYRSSLVPGIRATADAERLAQELALASARLAALATDPPGLYGEVARTEDREEAIWLALQTAYLGPLDGEEPWAGIEAVRTTWASGELPDLTSAQLGPRTSHEASFGTSALEAYRAWAGRAGTQADAFLGEPSWTAERRFSRVFERLAVHGLSRDARYDLLVGLGQLGLYEMRATALHVGGDDETTVAAKRVFGIGDTILLERRAQDLAEASALPFAALDAGLWNWARPVRADLGFPAAEPDADAYTGVAAALGL